MELSQTESSLRLQLHILKAELMDPFGNAGGHWVAVVTHRYANFRTAPFPLKKGKVDFAATRSFLLDYCPTQAVQKEHPFLRVVLASVNSPVEYEASVDHKTMSPFLHH
jgi:hypothetical protein